MTCSYCGNPSEFLCDAVIGYEAAIDPDSDPPRIVVKGPESAYTCDAPMCASCTIKDKNSLFYCGEDGCQVTIDDYCHIHADWHALKVDLRPLTEGGLQRLRESQRVDRAREQMRRTAKRAEAQHHTSDSPVYGGAAS